MASQRPPNGANPVHGDDEEVRARGIIVTVVAVVAAIVVLALLPSHTGSASPTTSSTTTTTLVAGGGSTTSTPGSSTTTAAATASGVKVALLAPSGAPSAGTIKSKLQQAGIDIVKQVTIPSSWVSSLTSPSIQYPTGLATDGDKIATALGISSGNVEPQQTSSTYGNDVVEVFVPSS